MECIHFFQKFGVLLSRPNKIRFQSVCPIRLFNEQPGGLINGLLCLINPVLHDSHFDILVDDSNHFFHVSFSPNQKYTGPIPASIKA